MKLPSGKIPVDILKDVVFKNLGASREEVVLGPAAGVDGAVLDLGEKSVVVSMDPITGAVERIGWLAVNVNANDVATFGVEPAFLFSCLMLPQGADKTMVEAISSQMGSAAKELGMAIVGGHCESTPKLQNPIVVCCAVGTTAKGKYVTAANAKAKDALILAKSAGIEGTAILAWDREAELKQALTFAGLQSAKGFYSRISIVKEALTAYKTGAVHAMHDPTEGGVAGGIHEMADAAGLGVKVAADKIFVEEETSKICGFFGVDPLQLISSGALLVSAQPQEAPQVIASLNGIGVKAAVIGEFVENPAERKLICAGGKETVLPRPSSDHLWAALSRQ
ncbi:MAG: AIR synthase family protein [Candidatus Bathyarchaeota archaeon]|nr:AIR synthase family protein [Candidatus Bathyarchaeota archaeon]